ncbi:MAG: hypothetical protein R3A51_00635 [Nannocystaceae bacterium]|nr:hypothetical protein [Myxococcales bacterium]
MQLRFRETQLLREDARVDPSRLLAAHLCAPEFRFGIDERPASSLCTTFSASARVQERERSP